MSRTRSRHRLFLLILLAGLTGAALYIPTLDHDLIWDDRYLVVVPASPAQGSFGELWTRVFPIGGGAYYRPLVLFTYWVENALFGTEPLVFHATQILLYGVSVAILLWLALLVIPAGPAGKGGRIDPAGPLAGALLFAVHPVHVEAVSFISGRADILATILVLAAVGSALKAAERGAPARVWTILSGTALLAGLLCKESAVVTPILTLLLLRPWSGSDGRARALRPLVAQFAALALYGIVRLSATGLSQVGDLPWGTPGRILEAFARNLELLLVPLRLRVYHRLPAGDEGTALALFGALALAGLAAAVFRAWPRSPRVAGAILWIPLSLLPVSGLLAFRGSPVSERFLFLPSAGLALLVALGVHRIRSRREVGGASRIRWAPAALLLLLLPAAAWSMARQPVYRSEQALFSRIQAEYPELPLGHLGLGIHLQRTGRPSEAIPHLERAVALSPREAPVAHQQGEAHRWLGLAYLAAGRVEEALVRLEEAASQRPEDAQLRVNLGSALLLAGRDRDAEEVLRDSLRLQPDLGQAEINLGIALARQGRHEEALPRLRRAAELMPRSGEAWFSLGNGQARLGLNDRAAVSFNEALRIDPGHEGARRNLAIVTGGEGSGGDGTGGR